ncbi:RNA polymerase sigma-70 factor [Maribacter sp. ACAM166]|uniref:RNA polymerase sigma-70 factor n=1 Tax=Maribacter sp. ACAM166 TaxID=2508996 RepID=UPI0010FEB434|nr:RNA polymerase sigma-70 factor [Maribacter sp. ACAM166]TLP71841.1 RNA polymerase sigma-70 factor [Maribacter sp. ACAM166]
MNTNLEINPLDRTFMMQKSSDKELLVQMALDSTSAFEAIYNQYSDDMLIYAMNIFRKKDVCEDVVQNVFIDFWSRRKELKINSLKAYLFQSVKYQIFNQIRNQKLSDEDFTRLKIIDLSMNACRKLEFDELELQINNQVLKLPVRCQQIFVLSRYEHKSNKQIAEELGISIQAVKNQISKALRSIRQNVTKEEWAFFFICLFHFL